MVNDIRLTLAVAGSGKTTGIVNSCMSADPSERILILTYTAANQQELRDRLAAKAGNRHNVEVSGWFAFLIEHFVRPYLPFAYPGRRLRGFDFASEPQQRVANDQWRRYFNKQSEVRKVHLAQIAHRVNQASDGAPLSRLGRIFDRIFIDEVQDLCGWDLEVLQLLMTSQVRLEMVGDVRQAILLTNARELKNKQYKFMKIWDWFRSQECAQRLTIDQNSNSYRCRPEITEFADALFSSDRGFATTTSMNSTVTDHDGIFLVKQSDVDAYASTYNPLVLRKGANSGRGISHLAPMNIGLSKGLGREHVLIYPTDGVKKLLQRGVPLDEQAAAYLYVAVTRAKQSVAFILDDAGASEYPYWTPRGVRQSETSAPLF